MKFQDEAPSTRPSTLCFQDSFFQLQCPFLCPTGGYFSLLVQTFLFPASLLNFLYKGVIRHLFKGSVCPAKGLVNKKQTKTHNSMVLSKW